MKQNVLAGKTETQIYQHESISILQKQITIR